MVKVIIVDDQKLLLEGTKLLLECDPDIKVIALASNGQEAYEKCHQCLPDVILMDIMMPICDGVKATQMIKKDFPSVKIIILTTFNDDENIIKALEEGADGYILKETSQEELIYAVKGINMGMRIIHQNSYPVLINKIVESRERVVVLDNDKDDLILSDTEKEILRYIVEGLENKEIAQKVCLSEGSVRNIISKMLGRFHMKDRIQLAVFAIKKGIYKI